LNPSGPPQLSSVLPLPSSVTSGFAKHSIYKLQIVGYLCRTEKEASDSYWCLIEAPDGAISTLKVDDYIGYEKAQVIDIKPTGIYLNVPQKKDLVFIRAKVSTPT